jgi:hypothetical protein
LVTYAIVPFIVIEYGWLKDISVIVVSINPVVKFITVTESLPWIP